MGQLKKKLAFCLPTAKGSWAAAPRMGTQECGEQKGTTSKCPRGQTLFKPVTSRLGRQRACGRGKERELDEISRDWGKD